MNTKSLNSVVGFALLFSIILTSCGDNKNYIINETNEFQNVTWSQADSLTFKANITDTTKRYNIGITLEHNKNYNYCKSK